MTNILEKSLLLAFGVFIIVSFFCILTPFTNSFMNFNNNQATEIDKITSIMEDIDSAVEILIDNPNTLIRKKIDYPNDLNLTFYENIVKYIYRVGSSIQIQFFQYSEYFQNRTFENIPPGIYVLKATYNNGLINISIC